MAFQNPFDSPLYSQKITGTLGYKSPVATKSVAPVSNSPSSRTKSFYDETSYMDWFQIGLVAVASGAAYGFTRFRGKLKEVIFFVYIILMLMPYQVTLVPNYLRMSQAERERAARIQHTEKEN